METIRIIRGDTIRLLLNFIDFEGDVYDLTDGIVFFTVKERLSDDDDDALILKNIDTFTEPESGEMILELSSMDTEIEIGKYWYDIQLKDSAGRIVSSEKGRFVVIADVTRR